MVSYMGSLVYDWLLSAGDKKLAEKFKKEAKPEPLPPNSPRLADIVKHYKETTPQKRKAEPAVDVCVPLLLSRTLPSAKSCPMRIWSQGRLNTKSSFE